MNVTVCIGSACHLKGSQQVADKLKQLIDKNGLTDKVTLNGTFCKGNCEQGVCVTVDGQNFSVKPETTEEFFNKTVLAKF